MKKALFLVSLVLLSLPVLSQGRKYNKSMQSAIEKMNEAPDPVSETEAAASFEEIALNYPDQWLPSYHASRILVTSSFEESDASKSDALLDRASPIFLEATQKFQRYQHEDPFRPTRGKNLDRTGLDCLKE